jgi:hypothetical protein
VQRCCCSSRAGDELECFPFSKYLITSDVLIGRDVVSLFCFHPPSCPQWGIRTHAQLKRTVSVMLTGSHHRTASDVKMLRVATGRKSRFLTRINKPERAVRGHALFCATCSPVKLGTRIINYPGLFCPVSAVTVPIAGPTGTKGIGPSGGPKATTTTHLTTADKEISEQLSRPFKSCPPEGDPRELPFKIYTAATNAKLKGLLPLSVPPDDVILSAINAGISPSSLSAAPTSLMLDSMSSEEDSRLSDATWTTEIPPDIFLYTYEEDWRDFKNFTSLESPVSSGHRHAHHPALPPQLPVQLRKPVLNYAAIASERYCEIDSTLPVPERSAINHILVGTCHKTSLSVAITYRYKFKVGCHDHSNNNVMLLSIFADFLSFFFCG